MFEFQAEAAEAGLQGRFALGIPLQPEVRGSTQRLGHQETEGMASSGASPPARGLRARDGTVGSGQKLQWRRARSPADSRPREG